MALPKGFKFYCGTDETTYVLAYGSNLMWERMSERCPSAEIVGSTVIAGYRMLFKQSKTGAYATIEQDANCHVPALIYQISLDDEAFLDRCEGYPKYYYKREFFLPVWNLDGRKQKNRKSCIAYILHEERILGEPSPVYFRTIESGYRDWGFDTEILTRALEDSIGLSKAKKWMKAHRK